MKLSHKDYSDLARQFVLMSENDYYSYAEMSLIFTGLCVILSGVDSNFNTKAFQNKVNNLKKGGIK
jgi:hypothetical protein